MKNPLTPKELGALFQKIESEPTGKLSELAKVAGLSLAEDYVGVDLSEDDLSEDDLSGADFSFSNLRNVNLKDTNLTNSNLSGANLSGANLSGANLSGANLSGANLLLVQAIETDFKEANLTGACIEDWHINFRTSFENVKCDYIFLRTIGNKEEKFIFKERRPLKENTYFEPGDFEKLIRKYQETKPQEDFVETVDIEEDLASISAINLSQWLNNIFDSTWQIVEDILGRKEIELLFAVRRLSNSRVIKAKEINLGKQANIRMVVDVMSISNNQRSIIVWVYPSQERVYLPLGLKFDILDSSGEFLQQKIVNSKDKWMRQEITGKLEEKFSVKFQLGGSTVVNNFVI